ncbi:MAG: glycosyl hydrolase [Streptomycetaceae bacterium]|nr:glycosyl hydrolase [Streptomycetaceae bacterium]
MQTQGLGRFLRVVGTSGGRRELRAAWHKWRADARDLPRRGAERARVPGAAQSAEPLPGGGVVRFARSALRIRVAVGGAVFCGWDGAEPEPSYALVGGCPDADVRATLEPDPAGAGWRVVSERITVVVTHHGTVEFRTPGGLLLRRELPPRWWDCPGDESRWVQRSQTPADARVFGLGGRAAGPRLAEGSYRLWNTDPLGSFEPGDDPLYITMPVQLVVADAGCHMVFHDNTWDGWVYLREGEEGAGSGHDRLGACEVRLEGGPLRYWVMAGTPRRMLRTWTALTGRPALPPRWALGYHHARWGFGDLREVRRVAEGYRERGLPLSALHLDIDHFEEHRVFTVDEERFPDLPGLSEELSHSGTRLVSIIDPAVAAQPGLAAYDSGTAVDAFVRDVRGRVVHGVVWPGDAVFPDFTELRVRKWWAGLYAERLGQGFAGFWHDMNEPTSFAAFGDRSLPRSARHALEGRGGDHREAHNVYGLAMARAGYEGLRKLRPGTRPFLFSRSGWAGMQRYGGTWSGDVATSWAGLRASLALALGLGLCGVPYSGPDVGGFSAVPSAELYVRWFQFAAYLPFFRTHSAMGAGRREPWEFGAEALECARVALAERVRLMPYFYTLAHLAHRTGAPYVRPLWWRHPEDRALRNAGDAFLLGDALLVAPVLDQGSEVRSVRLPGGRWYDTATGTAYEGPGQVLLEAPLYRIPVLARAGAVVPVAGEDGRTELEVWRPAAGREGGGVLITDEGDGWDEPRTERFTTLWKGDEVVVKREAAPGESPGELGHRVRLRGETSA